MKTNYTQLAILTLTACCFTACKSLILPKGTPTCIEEKAQAAISQPVQNPPMEIWEWKDNSNTYYYFNAPCCDYFSTLYDTECNKVCSPDGGFTGKGDGKCPKFNGELKKTQLWKDEREKNVKRKATDNPIMKDRAPTEQRATY